MKESETKMSSRLFMDGKIVWDFSQNENERFLTTQHACQPEVLRLERDAETGLDYRGARYYDSDVARFLSIDPLAAQYPAYSAYCYVAGNPIYLIDPNGKAPMDWIKNKDGKYVWDNTVHSASQIKDGQTYIGKDNIDIVKDLIGSKNIFNAQAEDYGIYAIEEEKGTIGSSYGSVFTMMNVSVYPNVSYDGDNRTFNGLNVTMNARARTTAPINIYQTLSFEVGSIKLNGNKMSKDQFQPPLIGPSINSFMQDEIPLHSGFISAKKVYSDRAASGKISVSLYGQAHFGDTPLSYSTIYGIIKGPNPTYLSVKIPYKK